MFGPDPVPTPETLPYWEGTKAGELRIQRCRSCRKHYFYPRPFCPSCSSNDVEWTVASGRGRLLSYIINYRPLPPAERDQTTVVVIVELEEGPRMTSVLVDVEPDPDLIALDAPLQVKFEAHGSVTLPVFTLVEAA